MSAIDKVLTKQAIALLERLESELPPGISAMFQFYNREGRDLELVVANLGRNDPGDTVKVLRALLDQTVREWNAAVRRYVAPAGAVPSEHVISSAEVLEAGAHEVVRLWSRGGLAGELVVSKGDGARMCCVMFRLEPEAT